MKAKRDGEQLHKDYRPAVEVPAAVLEAIRDIEANVSDREARFLLTIWLTRHGRFKGQREIARAMTYFGFPRTQSSINTDLANVLARKVYDRRTGQFIWECPIERARLGTFKSTAPIPTARYKNRLFLTCRQGEASMRSLANSIKRGEYDELYGAVEKVRLYRDGIAVYAQPVVLDGLSYLARSAMFLQLEKQARQH